MNPILAKYKELQHSFFSEHTKHYLNLLDNSDDKIRFKALKEVLSGENIFGNIKDYFNDPNDEIRRLVLEYAFKKEIISFEELKKFSKDKSSKVRKQVLELIAKISGNVKDILLFADDDDETVRKTFVSIFVEYFSEDYDKMPDWAIKVIDDYKKFIDANDKNIAEIITDTSIELKTRRKILRKIESYDNVTTYNTVVPVYFDVEPILRKDIINIISKIELSMSKKFFMDKMKEEENHDVFVVIVQKALTVFKNDLIDEELIKKLEDMNTVKTTNLLFKAARIADNMNYIDLARKLISYDEYVVEAAKYLLHFKDFTLNDKLDDFLNSGSYRRISVGLDIAKKFETLSYTDEIIEIAKDNTKPVRLRKKAIGVLKVFKTTDAVPTLEKIITNPEENPKLKDSALKALLKVHPESLIML